MLRQTLTSGFAIVGLLISCIDASGQPISPEPVQWKQSIERPSRGWDFDGKRILGLLSSLEMPAAMARFMPTVSLIGWE